MRKFSSYGPIDTARHFYVPRQQLLSKAYTQLLGENHKEGGYYITVWADKPAKPGSCNKYCGEFGKKSSMRNLMR